MSRYIPPALLAHFQMDVATTALCWALEMRNGRVIRGTEHDEDITVPAGGSPDDPLAGVYIGESSITGADVRSSTDMAVDNTEVEGALAPSQTITAVSAADIEAGLLNRAPVYAFLLNWADPAAGYVVIRRGFLGEIQHDSDGRYRTEVRGLVQLLSQQIVRTYGTSCDVVRLGDARCKVDVAALTITATVAAVESKRRFTITGITSQPAGYFSKGILRGVTGDNAGYEREVKLDDYNLQHGRIELWDPLPLLPDPGDTFALEPGCDRLFPTCRDKFGNRLNFRGHGLGIPGAMALLRGPLA